MVTGFLVLINCYSVRLAARLMVILTMLKFLAALFILSLGIYEVSTGELFTNDIAILLFRYMPNIITLVVDG